MANREIHDKKQEDSVFPSRAFFFKRAIVSVVIGVFIGLLAPFGTDQFSSGMAVTYWVVTCLLGFLIYTPTIAIADFATAPYLNYKWTRVALGAVIASVLMSFVIPLLGWLFFDDSLNLITRFSSIFPKTLIIGGAITIVSFMREQGEKQKLKLLESEKALATIQDEQASAGDKALEEFMLALPVDKRGALLCLEMSDHYVKVYTDKGHHMVLMRFKDAMKALDTFPGIQTHRSWWVTIDAVVKVQKEQRKRNLVLSNELVVPVSRTFEDAVKQAGFTK